MLSALCGQVVYRKCSSVKSGNFGDLIIVLDVSSDIEDSVSENDHQGYPTLSFATTFSYVIRSSLRPAQDNEETLKVNFLIHEKNNCCKENVK